jgi:hypothetical protein
MSEISITKNIELNSEVRKEVILEKVLENLKGKFDSFKTLKDGSFKCRVRTRIFNPIVSFSGKIECKAQGNRAMVIVSGSPKTNLWFWLTLFLGFIPPMVGWFFFVVGWLWHSQKKTTVASITEAVEKLNFDLWIEGAPSSKVDNIEAIGKLHNLLKAGAIYNDEFETQKRKLIA